MKRYEVSCGNSSRGEFKTFWFRKNAEKFINTRLNSPFITLEDKYKKVSENINWVEDNVWYRNKKKIQTKILKFRHDGLNLNFILTPSSYHKKRIIDNGYVFESFAVNDLGEVMYFCVGEK